VEAHEVFTGSQKAEVLHLQLGAEHLKVFGMKRWQAGIPGKPVVVVVFSLQIGGLRAHVPKGRGRLVCGSPQLQSSPGFRDHVQLGDGL
jgi:hypothetical protein